MPSNIILECSQFQSGSASNAEFVSTFKENVILEENDVFQMQQAMINTQTVSSGSILIEQDIDVSITVGFYECALGSFRFGSTSDGTTIRGNYNLPLPYGQIPQGTEPSKKNNHEIFPNTGFSDVQLHYNSLFNMPIDSDLIPPYHEPENFLHRPAGHFILRERAHNAQNQLSQDSPLVTRTVIISIKAGSYSPTKLASIITDQVTQTKDTSIGGDNDGMLIKVTGSGAVDENKFVRVGGGYFRGNNQVGVPYYSIKGDASVQRDRLIGASTFSFEFNDGVFAFTNMHSPIMGQGVGGSSQIYTLPSLLFLFPSDTLTAADKFDIVDAYTGCFITDLQPRAFWNRLGFADTHIDSDLKFDDAVFQTLGTGAFDDVKQFDYFNLRRVRPRVINADLVTPSQVGTYWVRRSWPLSQMTRKTDGTVGVQPYNLPFNDNNYQLFQSDDTFTLAGNTQYVINDFAYYRVEAETVFSNDYKQGGGRLGQVVGCVSTNYNSNDFVTGYGADSGVPYVHLGTPQIISAVKIRIIDPKTNQPVIGLGPNSTIFLEVVKAPPQPKDAGAKAARRHHREKTTAPSKK